MFAFDLSAHVGRVQMTGATRLEFLQRMSTNDVLKLQAGHGCMTALTTPIGRMVDAPAVIAMDDALILLTGAGNAGRVAAWLRKYVLYNDQVAVHDITAVTRMWGIYGTGADDKVRAMDEAAFEQLQTAPDYSSATAGPNLLVKMPPIGGAGYALLGAKLPGIEMNFAPIETYEAMRIAAGYPAAPSEINEDYIPLETGLWHAVSFHKGCYIGQEIIARMESRGQVAKKLVQLKLADATIRAGADLQVDGNLVGKVTSASESWALGYVRSAHAQVGQVLQTAAGEVAQVSSIIGEAESVSAS